MHLELLPLVHILVAGLLAGIVGLERQLSDEAAGLRAHLLVGMGACLFALVSIYGLGFALPGSPDTRIAANIVTGVGFLGAGAILRSGPAVRGLGIRQLSLVAVGDSRLEMDAVIGAAGQGGSLVRHVDMAEHDGVRTFTVLPRLPPGAAPTERSRR